MVLTGKAGMAQEAGSAQSACSDTGLDDQMAAGSIMSEMLDAEGKGQSVCTLQVRRVVLAARAGMPSAALGGGAATAGGAAGNAVTPAGEDAEAPRTTAAEDYEKILVAGEGTFGVVWKVRHRATGAVFAMKKMRFQARDRGVSAAAIDEISALQVRVCESWLCRVAPAQPL